MTVVAGILLTAGICSIVYFGAYAILVDLTNTFTWFWLALGILCILAGAGLIWLHLRRYVIPVGVRRTLGVLAGLGILCFLVTEGVIVGYGRSKPVQDAEYMIVLGARIRGSKVTANLARRLDTAYQYLEENPETKAILSGGQGTGEDIAEAEAMAAYLEDKGIARERMILEDQSVNTYENIKYSREKMESQNATVVLVTNDFHVFRGTHIAKKQGLSRVYGLGAPTKWYTVPNMYVREAFAVWKYTVCGQMSLTGNA